MKIVVMINGEAQVGKSTLAKSLVAQLESKLAVQTYSLVEPLRNVLSGFSSLPYEEAKAAQVVEHPSIHVTGRDIMIACGNAMRDLHPALLSAVAWKYLRSHPIDVLVIENWGFHDELFYFRSLAAQGACKLVTVSLVHRQKSDTKCGERFPNDSRFRLDHLSDMVDPDPAVLAHHVLNLAAA